MTQHIAVAHTHETKAIGYQAECSCGWVSVTSSVSMAGPMRDFAMHLRDAADLERAGASW